jgi:pyrroline-5-carboxylate reductase
MNVTFIGGGNMAQAIIGGLLRKDPLEFARENLHVVEIDAGTRAKLERDFGVKCFSEASAGLRRNDVIVLAVKPQKVREVASLLGTGAGNASARDSLVISIAAGVRLADLGRWLGGHTRLVRAMPNTPALIGEGITAIYPFPHEVGERDLQQAERILGAIGETIRVQDEQEGDKLLDAVTAVSGSGPAYVFFFMEAIEQAAGELNLPKEAARRLVLQTFIGAARLAAESPEALSVLRERVTSKGGTTEAALKCMTADRIKDSIIRAVKAAYARGAELGEQLGRE